MPDDMDANYAPQYPTPALQRQSAHASGRAGSAASHRTGPVAASIPRARQPRSHPGSRWQSHYGSGYTSLAGPLLFTTTTTPGLALRWNLLLDGQRLELGYLRAQSLVDASMHLAKLTCTPDTNGYNTGDPTAINYYEWCQITTSRSKLHPFGDVASGGPATLPDSNILANGAWYGGSPLPRTECDGARDADRRYDPTFGRHSCQLGPPARRTSRIMWHSHNEREITTNNIFPGGMMMMMLVDSREFLIDESN